jgi:hypothetical protein
MKYPISIKISKTRLAAYVEQLQAMLDSIQEAFPIWDMKTDGVEVWQKTLSYIPKD